MSIKLPNPKSKKGRILAAFLRGESLNLIEAQQLYHDRDLRSTVSSLQIKFGIKVSREYEIIAGYQGFPTRCCRYWIEQEERARIENKDGELPQNKKQTEMAVS